MKIKEEWNKGPKEEKFVLDKNFEEYYELLNDGRAVCLNEYCTWIADTRYEERFTDLSEEEQKKDLFSSKTFVVQMNDGDNKIGVLNWH